MMFAKSDNTAKSDSTANSAQSPNILILKFICGIFSSQQHEL